MKKLVLLVMIAFGTKVAMAQTGEALALSKVGTAIHLDSISGSYNGCNCYVLDTMFKLVNTGTALKPVMVAGYGANKSGNTAGWTVSKNVITLKNSSCYYLPGIVHLDTQIVMNVPAGTKFYGSNLTASAFVVLRGAMLNAKGTAAAPIVMTSAKAPNSRNRGDWGGLVIAGRAPIAGSADGLATWRAGNYSKMEGLKDLPTAGMKNGTKYYAGGTMENDNSGMITYLQVNYGGYNVGAAGSGNELNGITLYGVGNKTVMKNIQVTEANDDGIEFFGGSVNVSNVLLVNTLDDDLDIDCGYQGVIQNVVIMRLDSNSRDVSGSKMVEASAKNQNHPRMTNAIITNLTAFGPRSFAGKSYVFGKTIQYYNPNTLTWRDTTPSGNNAVDFFRGVEVNTNANISIYNSIIHGYDQAINIADAQTANNIDSGMVFAFNTINNCTEAISTMNKKTLTAAAAFQTSNAFPRNSATNWLKYDQSFNNILTSDAIKAQGYDITFTQNALPSLSSIAFYSLYGKEYPATSKALQTLGTSWTADSQYLLDKKVKRKYAMRIDNRGVKNFFAAGGFELDPTTDYCAGQTPNGGSDDKGVDVNVNSRVYVENPSSFGTLNVGFDQVNTDKINVAVYDLSGKKMFTKNVNVTETSGMLSIDASTLVDGIYLVETTAGGVKSSTKVVINK